MAVAHAVARLLDPDLPLIFLAEGVVWDSEGERLLWVEIASGTVYVARWESSRPTDVTSRRVDSTVGAVLPADDGGIVVAGARHVHYIDSAGAVRASIEVIPAGAPARLNDATVDPKGRVLVGTAPLDGSGVGRQLVASVEPGGEVRTILTGLNLANGMEFSDDGRTLYAVDSIPGRIVAIPYDVDAGVAGPGRSIWSGSEIPDGMTLDSDGNLWVAFFGSGQVRCLDPAGSLLATVDVPAPHPTCPAFVGPALDLLVVTTAQEKLTAEQLREWPLSGGLFVAEVGATGRPVRLARAGDAA